MEKKSLIQTIAVLALTSSFATSTAADTINPDKPGDFTSVVTGKMKERLEDKHLLVQLHEKVKSGKASQAQEDQAFKKFVDKWGGAGLKQNERSKSKTYSNFTMNSISPNAQYSSRYVMVTQLSQPNNYYCGPATATEIIREIGVYPKQTMDTSASYLGTTTDGTVWSKRSITGDYYYPMADTLDYYSNSANNYTPEAAPSASTFKSDVTYTLDKGYPVAADCVENAGGTHLVGHPTNLTIYHWIALDAYTSSGDNTQYADSASGGQGFSSAWDTSSIPGHSTLSTSTLAGLAYGRGIIW